MVAGMTSEGGGAVAFPVRPLTLPLAFNNRPCPPLTSPSFPSSVVDLHEGHILTQVSHSALLQVMTLALGIAPTVARDFSVMIQSVGEYYLKWV